MSEMEPILAFSSDQQNIPCPTAKRKRAGFTLLEPASRYPCFVYFVRPETLKIGNDRELFFLIQLGTESGHFPSHRYPSLADDFFQYAQRMMPCVGGAVQGRWRITPIRIGVPPAKRSMCIFSMTADAIFRIHFFAEVYLRLRVPPPVYLRLTVALLAPCNQHAYTQQPHTFFHYLPLSVYADDKAHRFFSA
jgi:hypothetical protein